MANQQSIFKSLTSINAFRLQTVSPGNTLTTGPVAAGDDTVAVTAITNFSEGDPVFILGTGGLELLQIGDTPATTMPIARPAVIPQDSGALFKEAVMVPLGHILDNSVSFGATSSNTPVTAADTNAPVAYYFVAGGLTFKFGLLGFTTTSLAMAFSQAEVSVGTGTSSDPTQMLVNGDTIGSQGLLCFRMSGVLFDGSFAEVDVLDVTISGTTDINVSGKSVSGVSIAGAAVAHIIRLWS